jgi:hypothetical protein
MTLARNLIRAILVGFPDRWIALLLNRFVSEENNELLRTTQGLCIWPRDLMERVIQTVDPMWRSQHGMTGNRGDVIATQPPDFSTPSPSLAIPAGNLL